MSVSDSVQALEPRIMFDAAGVATGVEVAVDSVAEQQAEQALTPENLQAQAANQENEENEKVVEALAGLVPPAGRNEIIFVDKGVADYASLISEISGDAELIFIDANSDGLEQIANALHDRNDIDAIHIVSHGESGELFLGNTTLTQESIQGEHADELATIKSALSEQADLLIYGCSFAEGELGKAAAVALAEATGADVAASEDLTGAESLGGDWDLEFISGDVGTVTLNAETYEGILFAPTDLTFIDSTEVTGDGDTDGELGEVFRFHDVSGDGIDDVTPAAGSIDAIITITDLSYIDSATGLAIGTDTPILEDWDRAGSGALDPVLDARTITGGAIQGSEISATFTIQYVLADTNTSVSVDSFVSPIDIDSSANLREAVSVTAPVVSVIQNSPTTLTTELTHENGLTTIALEQATLNNHNPGVTNTPEFAAMFQVQQADIFTVQIRSIIEGATPQTGERLFSLSFSETSFTTANTLSVPIVDLDLNDSSGATDLDYQNTTPYQAGDPAISIVDSDVTITDSDPNITDMQSASITLTNAQAGDVLTVGTLPTGITATGSGTDTITLSGVASIADYQDALKAITYSNTNPTTISGVDRTIEVTINNGDIDSPVATATIDVFGTPTVDTQTTTNTQPTITGTWDINNGSATGLQVTVNGTTYTLGTDPALTTDANGNWSLNLSTAGQTLPVATYNVSVSTTDGTNTVVDETTNELTVILNPEWSFTGDADVLEGDSASYTLSLVGAESIPAGQTVAVVFNTSAPGAGIADEGTDYDLDQALINAAATRTELSYVPGSFELVYTSPGTPAAFTDLIISVTTTTAPAAEGTETFDLTLATGTGTATSTISTTANTVNTTIYESLTAPTLTATPDGTTNFTEGDTNKDLFDSVTIDPIEPTQTIEEIVFDVVDAVDGANEVLNIDGIAIPMTTGTGTTASGYTYTVTDNGGNDFTVTLTTTGASSAAIQTLVDGMSYRNNLVDTPTAGDRTVTIESITDSGASNNQTTGINITETITVVPVNDAPVVNAPVLPLAYTAGMDIHGTGFTAADIDAGTASNLVVTLSSNDGNITVAAGNSGLGSITGNGSPTVTLTGTITQIDNFLKGNTTGTINYTTLNGVPGDDTFTVSVNDMGNTGGGNLIGSNSVVINTTGNAAPVLDLDANNSTATGNDYAATFTEGGSAVNIVDSDTSLTDTESDDVTLQIVAGNIADGANEILNFGTGQILLDGTNDATLNNQTVNGVVVDVFYDASAQTITITDQDGNALTLTEATDVLEGITYQNNDGSATIAPARTFTITANDGVTSNSAVSTISLVNTENAPVNTVPAGTQNVNEDTTLNLTGISVTDSDGNLASTQLTVTNGVLNVTLSGAATISAGANGTNTLTISGSETDINATLASLTYQGNLNFSGSDTLTVLSTDSTAGTPLTDSDTVAINVIAVNDAPVIDLDVADGGDTNFTTTYTENTAAINIADTGNTSVTDVEGDEVTLQIVAANIANGADERLNFGANQIPMDGVTDIFLDNVTVGGVLVDVTYTAATNTFSITDSTGGTLTTADAVSVIDAITYQNDSDGPTGVARTFTITADDGAVSNGVVSTVNVVAANDAPDGTDNTVTTNEDIDHV
ncbi:MAG: DUF4347 domain-containing protein, partial [Proteobacteria bacterium]|nr:DUF4347 domain-containing protein [Pseudomonadota bacterium]